MGSKSEFQFIHKKVPIFFIFIEDDKYISILIESPNYNCNAIFYISCTPLKNNIQWQHFVHHISTTNSEFWIYQLFHCNRLFCQNLKIQDKKRKNCRSRIQDWLLRCDEQNIGPVCCFLMVGKVIRVVTTGRPLIVAGSI